MTSSRWPLPSLLLSLLVQSAASSPNATNASPLQTVTLAAILPLTNTAYAWAWPRVGAALQRAVRQVNSDPTLLPGLTLRLVHNNSENADGFCSDFMAPLVAVDLREDYNPWAFIGPGCDYSSSPVARFTTHWDIPMVSGKGVLGHPNVHASVTNTGPTHQKLGELGLRLQARFEWQRRAMLVYSDNKDANDDRPCYFAVEGFYTVLGDHNITVMDHSIETDNVNYGDVVKAIRNNARGSFD
uniref:Receptor ligand binding region domain-containing protein n=1 Tax=Sander lucioperca TaxID=283035 RepID=A0A8D0CSS8_SANLU